MSTDSDSKKKITINKIKKLLQRLISLFMVVYITNYGIISDYYNLY